MTSFQNIRDLETDGKMHKKLLFRVRILTIISVLLLSFVIYRTLLGDLNVFIVVLLVVLSFPLGLFVFSKMNKVVWDEEGETIMAGKMELAGFAIVALYILFEITLRTYLKAEYAETFAATGYLLAGIGASLLGRSVGTLVAVQKLADAPESGNS